ncbi:SufD family Fe-S cluster assembly protein [Paenibacillus elgii]|uniref:SufD family Fe-S cluster assembly protein n=1 Tax=Paenibacillus elgii TaxID=189691 RepID=UPI0013D105A3|nr:SufD family Fe-S cluster assembly protein [Paenibacillus elgii]
MAYPKTPNLQLNKVDRSSPNTMLFNTKPLIDDNVDILDTVIPLSNMARQAIINGNFDVWQRGTVFSTNSAYTCDRFSLFHNHTSASVTRQETFAPIGSRYNLRLTNVTRGSGTYLEIVQAIETINCVALIGKTVTLSFQVRKSSGLTSGDVAAYIKYRTIIDDNSVSVANGTITGSVTVANANLTTSHQLCKVTATIPTTARTIGVVIALENSPTDGGYIDIAQVQLCAGDVDLPFQPRSFAEEEIASMRYARRIGGVPFSNFGLGQAFSSTQARISIPIPVRFRIQATSLVYGGNLQLQIPGGVAAVTSLSIDTAQTRPDQIVVTATVAGGLTDGQVVTLRANNDTTAFLLFDAEL